MKIGIVTEYFYPTLGGITENIYHFSRELLNRGHDLRIITGFRGKPTGIDDEIVRRMIFIGRNVPIFYNGSCARVTFGISLSRKVRDMLRSEAFDIIHLHSPLFPTLPMIANMQANAPVVATFHTCTESTIPYRFYKRPLQQLIDSMAARIAVSDCCAIDNQRVFRSDFHIIPNGVDVKMWSEPKGSIDKFRDGRVNILFLGRPDTRNGLESLIRAFARVHAERRDTRLIIVGDGPLAFYFKNIVPDEIKGDVIFEGSANETRPAYLAAADVIAFLPDIASFGITILEGMSAGKAILASDIEAFRALVQDGESALLVSPRDENAIAEALIKLIDDRELRLRLGAKAKIDAEIYDWKKVADQHLELYSKLI